ncbi:MAG: hypothetical protein IPO21_15050 [Bacteroidales bacterium]|nr:hypothetical protein [Bacteroidales bacterium]
MKKLILFLRFFDICKHINVDFSTFGIDSSFIATYEWDFGDSTEREVIDNKSYYNNYKKYLNGNTKHAYVDSGTYYAKLIITDIQGCKDSITYPIPIVVKGPKARFDIDTNSFCDENFSVHFSDNSVAHGTTPIKTWFWEYGDEASILNTTNDDTWHDYSNTTSRKVFTPKLTVTDELGCYDFADTTFTSYRPHARFYSNDTLRCGLINLNLYNNSDAYITNNNQFTWLLNGTNFQESVTGFNASFAIPDIGNYSVSLLVVDDGGCKDSITKNDYVKRVFPVADFSIGSDTSRCVGEFSLPFTSTSLFSSSYEWSFGDGENASTNNLQVSHFYKEAGWYDINLIVSGLDGCKDTTSKSVKIKGPKGKLSVSDFYICLGELFSASVSGVNIKEYFWDFDDLSPTNDYIYDSIVSHKYLQTGSFTPNVILLSSEGCQVVLSLEQPIFVDKFEGGVDMHLDCKDEFVELKGTSTQNIPGVYIWESDTNSVFVPSNVGLTVQVDKPGTYILKAKDSMCAMTDTVIVTSSGNYPQISAGSDKIIDCMVDSMRIEGLINSLVDTFYWESPVLSQISNASIPQPDVNSTGMYVLHAQHQTCLATDTMYVSPCTLTPKDTVVWLCSNFKASVNTRKNYNLSLSESAAYGDNISKITWFKDSLFLQAVSSPQSIDIEDSTVLFAKIQSFDLVQTAKAQVLFRVHNYIEINYNEIPEVCAKSGSIQLAEPVPSGGVYSGIGISATGLFAEQAVAQKYPVVYTYTHLNGCSNSIDISINVNPLPQIVIQTNPIDGATCSGDTILLQVNASGGRAPYLHQWICTDATLVNDTLKEAKITNAVNVITRNKVYYSITDSMSCKMKDSVYVVFYPYPVIDFSAVGDYCNSVDSVALSDNAIPVGGAWSGKGVDELNGSYTFRPNLCEPDTLYLSYSISNITTFSLPLGVPECISIGSTPSIIYPLPQVSLVSSRNEFCFKDTLLIEATGNALFYSYLDKYGNNTYIFPEVGDHKYYVTAYNEHLCESNDSISITIHPLPIVSIESLLPICENAESFTLIGRNEYNETGFYSGLGVSDNTFNPVEAGPGEHIVSYYYTDFRNCTDTAKTVVNVGDMPFLYDVIGMEDVCSGDTITINYKVKGGHEPYTYDWSTLNKSEIISSEGSVVSVTKVTKVQECSGLMLRFTDDYGCVFKDTLCITFYPYPEIVFSELGPFCSDSSLIDLSNMVSPKTGKWSGIGVTSVSDTYSFQSSEANVGENRLAYEVYARTQGLFQTDIFKCASYDTISVTVNPLPKFTLYIDRPEICLFNTASLSIDGDALNTYVWNDTAMSGMKNESSPTVGLHQYIVNASDSNGCEFADSETLLVRALPTVSIDSVLPVCIYADTLKLVGHNDYDEDGLYFGNGVEADNFIPVKAGVGVHKLVYLYTDDYSCTNIDSTTILVNPRPLANLSAFPSDAEVCSNDTVVIENNLLTDAMVRQTWTSSEGTITINQFGKAQLTDKVSVLTSREVYYSILDTNGCENYDTLTAKFYQYPIVSFTSFGPFCIEDDRTSLMSIATPLGGEWLGNGIVYDSSVYYFSPANMGVGNHSINYSIDNITVFQLTDDEPLCVSKDSLFVVLKPLPELSIPENIVFCKGENYELKTQKNHDTFNWNTGDYTRSITVIETGTYIVIVSENGCYATDSTHVLVNELPEPQLANDTSICENSSILIELNEIFETYVWNTLATASSIKVSTEGMYVVAVSKNNCFASDTINISIISLPQPSLPIDTSFCDGDSIVLVADTADLYVWSTGATTQSFVVKQGGVYTIDVEKNGCSNSDTINIEMRLLPVITLPDSLYICESGYITAPDGFDSYQWSDGTMEPTIQISQTGDYELIVEKNRCTAQDTLNVTIESPIILTIPDTLFNCEMDTLVIHSNVSVLSYLWNTGATSNSIFVTEPDIYYLYVTNKACENSDTVVVVSKPRPHFEISGSEKVCVNTNNSPYTSISNDANLTYKWQLHSKNYLISGNSSGITYIDFMHEGVDTLDVTAYNSFGCENRELKIIEIAPQPDADFSTSEIANYGMSFIDQTPLTYIEDSERELTQTYKWHFGRENDTLVTVNQQDTTLKYSYGYYDVIHIVQNEFGCTDTIKKLIFVDVFCSLYLPNAF